MQRYEKLKVIGQGAFGKVFLYRRVSDKVSVVIKQIPVDELPSEERKASINEVNVLKMLQHPNIVAYYDNFVEDKSLMIVMEYAPGGTLCELIIERNGKLMEEEIVVAIEHVHSQKILHRDLKPQNIMLNKNKTVVKVGDFGISKVLSSKITSAQTVVGTPCYISPEICEGRVYRKKSDIWALGCILYELAMLIKAFEGPNLPALVMKIMQASDAVAPINAKYSGKLQVLINSMLQRNPDDRPSIESIMANTVVVNALVNLGTDVGRLPYSRPPSSSGSGSKTRAVGVRMGSSGSYRQRSFFEEDYHPSVEQFVPRAQSKPNVYMWGGGVAVPLILPSPSDNQITHVALGRTHKMGITGDGKIIAWELTTGSLGTMTGLTMTSRAVAKEPLKFHPVPINGLNSVTIKKVACGDLFAACLTDKGIIMTFGSGVNGCLGHGNYDDVTTPKLVEKMLQYETLDIACGSNHMMAITADPDKPVVHSWGRGESGQLGTGSQYTYATPHTVPLPRGGVASSVICGTDCSIIITSTGSILATGSNVFNKLGLNGDVTTPITTPTNQPAILAMAGRQSYSDLSRTSLIMSSVLGASRRETPEKPIDMGVPETSVLTFRYSQSSLLQEKITSVAIGSNHSAFINVSGECITCGSNKHGQLGYDTPPSNEPRVVEALKGKRATLVGCGDSFTTICTTGGVVYSWGSNRRGRLGRESNPSMPLPLTFEESLQPRMLSCNNSISMLLAGTS